MGTETCGYAEGNGGQEDSWVCNCIKKPRKINYDIYWAFAQAVKANNMHLNRNGKDWERFVLSLFTN